MKRRIVATFCLLTLLICGLLLTRSLGPTNTTTVAGRSPAGAVFQTQAQPGVWTVSEPVEPILTDAVRDLPNIVEHEGPTLEREVNPRIIWDAIPQKAPLGQRDPLLDQQAAARAPQDASFLTPSKNTDGQGYSFVNPPDPSADVGPDHFVHMINASGGTSVVIYDKDLNILKGPFMLDSLGSGSCASGLGDPIVLYDRLADRWFFTEFSSGGNQLCLYVSQTPDPTGAFYHYAFTGANGFPDYPKYGVWPDAYYAGTNESVPTVYAFDRVNMLAGNAATYQSFNIPGLSGFGFEMLVPSDLDGATPPPANSPNYFMRHRDTESHGAGSCPNGATTDCLEIFEFDVDWATPANSAVNGPMVVSMAEIDSDLCGLSSFFCIPQNGSGTTLDPLREVVMQRLQYRNFGTHEVLVGNLATDVSGSDQAGVRWFELRKTGSGGWTLHQEGTYAPDSHSRWMGSAAMDQAGNIAVAYSVSSSSMYPSLRYAGRLANDPIGTLPQGEGMIIEGSAPNSSNRYGDYSQLGVDPFDDCTFWFTGQYNPSTNWSTRIVAFKFAACGEPSVAISAATASAAMCETGSAEYLLSLAPISGFDETVTLSTSGISGISNFSNNPITNLPSTSTLTVSGVTPGNHTFNVVGTSGALNVTRELQLTVDANVAPAAATLTAPANGANHQPTAVAISWQTATNASSYTLQVATDPDFQNMIVNVPGLTTTSYPLTNLEALKLYYWRVITTNLCQSTTSDVAVFGTSQTLEWCSTPNINIPDNTPAGITTAQTISDNGTFTDLDVLVEATHTYVGDLRMTLQHAESGTTVTLLDRPGGGGCSGNNIDMVFDDEATNPAETTCASNPALSGALQPTGNLSDFDGENINGNWSLTVSDNAGIDIGTLTRWCLQPAGIAQEIGSDYSDLPVSYGIASHSGDGSLTIGARWTADTVGTNNGDDNNDDGIMLPLLFADTATTVKVSVLGNISGSNAWLQAWFDWNANGMFDSDELVYNGAAHLGLNTFSITPPTSYDPEGGVSYRVRLFDSAAQPASGVSPSGSADSGEVTDGSTGLSQLWLPITPSR